MAPVRGKVASKLIKNLKLLGASLKIITIKQAKHSDEIL